MRRKVIYAFKKFFNEKKKNFKKFLLFFYFCALKSSCVFKKKLCVLQFLLCAETVDPLTVYREPVSKVRAREEFFRNRVDSIASKSN